MRVFVLSCGAFLAIACSGDPLDAIASSYVELARAAERQDSVDESSVQSLLTQLHRVPPSARARYLTRQLEALAARGRTGTFDEESRAFYDVVAPRREEAEAAPILAELESLLPGEGSLVERYAEYERRFVVPRDRLDAVVEKAIDACRQRTVEHVTLPRGERVHIEYVRGAPWPSFHEYRGEYRSVVRINRDFPLTARSALDIACHEAYPGHHTASVILDRELVRERGFVEFSVQPLHTPHALVLEGLASLAIELAFSSKERLRFEKEVLYPLAGLDPMEAERYARIRRLVDRLEPFAVEGARRFVDRERDRVAIAIWLERNALSPDPFAFLRFVDRYRSYVVTYTLGEDLVRRYIEESGADPWRSFTDLLGRPVLPSDLDDAT